MMACPSVCLGLLVKEKVSSLGLQPAGETCSSQGFGMGVRPKRNGRCHARGATMGYPVTPGLEKSQGCQGQLRAAA